MPFIEAPTTFYLGRQYDPNTNQLIDDVVYYDSRDLTTHAVVVGMTGSGKTGLCICLLEEAALDNIPAIIIDPKGDITNLALQFEGLTAQEFLPWINVDDARRAGMSVQEYAQDVAQRWKDGLASWGIGARRIQTLKNQVEINIFTPGSDAGLPISILEAMQAPRNGWAGQEEYHREQIRAITTALLTLIGMNADPVKDREHVLISNIFEFNWRQGIDLSMENIIVQVQEPPFQKLGVLDIDTFFPEKARFKLAMELNSIIAAPSFQSWLRGEPLDVQHLMYNAQGKPRVNVFYIAHLDEAQRSFIITLLLESMLASMRTMSGTTSLRAILYFDEVFGHFPPYPKNPPTKQPLLRLLKQARAFGIGLVLATQNPGDLDYKGLSNAGTWFIGRLQTENDKNKVLDGLSTAATVENQLNVADLDRLISSVDPRVFVMHNVHTDVGPILMHTRWAMSYLRGPLTRDQIHVLMQRRRQEVLSQQQAYAGQPSAYQQPGYGQQTGGYQQPGYAPPAAGSGGYTAPQSASWQAPQSQQQQPPMQPVQQPSQGFTPYTPPPSVPTPPPLPQSGFATPPPAPYDQQVPPPPPTGAPIPPPNLPEQFSTPAAPPPGLPESYAPQGYQPPQAPYQQEQFEEFAPSTYQAPLPPYQVAGGPSGYNAQQSGPFGGTGQYTPPPGAPMYTPPPAQQMQAPQSGTGYSGGTQPQTQTGGTTQPDRSSFLPDNYTFTRPALGSSVDQYFFPKLLTLKQAIGRWERQFGVRAQGIGDSTLAYWPFLLVQAQVRYLDRKTSINMVETYAYHIQDLQKTGLIHWDDYVVPSVSTRQLSYEPAESGAAYADVPPGVTDRSRMSSLKKEIVDYLSKTAGLVIPHNPSLDIFGMPGAGYNDFRMRVAAAAREGRDDEVDKLTMQYESKFDQMEDRYEREARELKADEAQLRELGREELFTMGEAFMSLLKGRTAYTLSRVSRARRYKGHAREDLSESEAILQEIEENMDQLQARFEFELAKIQEKWSKIASHVEEYRITPYKKDIHLEVFGVGWMPQHIMVLNNQPVVIDAWEPRTSDRVRQEESQYQGGPQFSESTYGQPMDGPRHDDQTYDQGRDYDRPSDRGSGRDYNYDYDAGYQRDDYRQRGGYADDPDRRY